MAGRNQTIRIDRFGGIAPKVDPLRLPQNMAQKAENCRLASGVLEALRSPGSSALLASATVGFDPKDVATFFKWKYRDAGVDYSKWLYWNSDVDVVDGPIFDDDYNRIYFAENGTLKVRSYSSSHTPADNTRTVFMPTPDKIAFATKTGTSPVLTDAFLGALRLRFAYFTVGGYDASPVTLINTTAAPASYDLATGKVVFNFAKMTSANYAGGGVMPRLFQLEYADSGTTYKLPNVDITSDPLAYSSLTLPDTGFDCKIGGATVATMTVTDVDVVGWNSRIVSPGTAPSLHSKVNHREIEPFTVTLQLSFSYPDQEEDILRSIYYVQTYVNTYGEEGPPSAVSDLVTKKEGEKVVLSNLGAAPNSSYSIQYRRIYRTAGTENAAGFYFVDQVSVATTSHTDTKGDQELGELLEYVENPPSGLSGLVNHPNGFLAGFTRRDVWFGNPWKPYSWPSKWSLVTDHDIVALAVAGNEIYVLTTGFPYRIIGSHPDSLAMEALPYPQACVSKRSVSVVSNMVCYASPDGYVAILNGMPSLLTAPHYSRREWQALLPGTMRAETHDGMIVLSSSTGTLIIEPAEGKQAAVTTTTVESVMFFHDLESDLLYLIRADGTARYQETFATGTGAETAVWKSRTFEFPEPVAFAVLLVRAESYPSGTPITVKVESETQSSTVTVTAGAPRWIPVMRPERKWTLTITTVVDIHSIAISTSMQRLRA